VAASKEGSGIRIVNEPFLGSSGFLVEAGESRTRPETTLERLLDWLNPGHSSLVTTMSMQSSEEILIGT